VVGGSILSTIFQALAHPARLSSEHPRGEQVGAPGSRIRLVIVIAANVALGRRPGSNAPLGPAQRDKRRSKVVAGYLLALVRCGNEFQDASRRQVLLVDPHAEG